MDKDNSKTSFLDIHVGLRIRSRRMQLRISQEKLGNEIGVTFQQVQKYEKGQNRIGAGQLFAIARLLKVEPNFFFDGLAAKGAPGFAEAEAPAFEAQAPADALAMNRAFARVKSHRLRRRIVDLVAAIAETERED
ncbi:MAG: helix-turn-helix transcriptional regulator [Hyphomicrobiales bacterium]|nr:helix-turn-helix transcriptional regulator [Hyphomicrobiales bacterium]